MKKKIISIAIMSVLLAGTVSASSINGDYKGNPIVKVRVNGSVVDSEVPAQNVDGTTLLPLRAVSQALGADVQWNQDTYSVDVSVSASTNTNENRETLKTYAKIADLYKITEDLSKEIKSYSEFLSVYFTNENMNYSSKISDQQVIDRLSQIIDQYNFISNLYNNLKSSFGNNDTGTLLTAIKTNYDAIEKYKAAQTDVFDWKQYRFSNPQKSDSSFNSYLNNSNSGFTLSSQAQKISYEGYNKYIFKVIY